MADAEVTQEPAEGEEQPVDPEAQEAEEEEVEEPIDEVVAGVTLEELQENAPQGWEATSELLALRTAQLVEAHGEVLRMRRELVDTNAAHRAALLAAEKALEQETMKLDEAAQRAKEAEEARAASEQELATVQEDVARRFAALQEEYKTQTAELEQVREQMAVALPEAEKEEVMKSLEAAKEGEVAADNKTQAAILRAQRAEAEQEELKEKSSLAEQRAAAATDLQQAAEAARVQVEARVAELEEQIKAAATENGRRIDEMIAQVETARQEKEAALQALLAYQLPLDEVIAKQKRDLDEHFRLQKETMARDYQDNLNRLDDRVRIAEAQLRKERGEWANKVQQERDAAHAAFKKSEEHISNLQRDADTRIRAIQADSDARVEVAMEQKRKRVQEVEQQCDKYARETEACQKAAAEARFKAEQMQKELVKLREREHAGTLQEFTARNDNIRLWNMDSRFGRPNSSDVMLGAGSSVLSSRGGMASTERSLGTKTGMTIISPPGHR